MRGGDWAVTGWRFSVGTALTVAALLAAAGLAGRSAFGSDDPCTATGSSLNGGPSRNVGCGGGVDVVDMDLVDAVTYDPPLLLVLGGCEGFVVGAVDEGPNVVIAARSRPVGQDGRTSVRLRCPASLLEPPRCEGTLKLQLSTRSSLRRTTTLTHYSIHPGQSRSVRVRLSHADRRTLRARGRASGVVTSVEMGQHGKKTTVQTIGLAARR